MREEGVALVKKFDGEFPERWADEIFKYLSINKNEFPKAYNNFESPIFDRNYYDLLCDNARSPHIWYWDEEDGWQLRSKVYEQRNQFEIKTQAEKWEGNKV